MKTEGATGRQSKNGPGEAGTHRREVPSITTEILEEDEGAFLDYEDGTTAAVKTSKDMAHRQHKRKNTVPSVA